MISSSNKYKYSSVPNGDSNASKQNSSKPVQAKNTTIKISTGVCDKNRESSSFCNMMIPEVTATSVVSTGIGLAIEAALE